MMLTLFLALSCPPTHWQNVSKEAWNDYDRSIYQQALNRCPQLYGKDYVCISLMRKYKPLQYTILCGTMKNKE
jgi:hypothetical protein